MRKGLHGELEGILDLIDTHEQVLGAEHLDTLMAGDQLACVLKNQGFLESAETVLEGVCTCFDGTDGSRKLRLDKAARFLISLGSLARIKGLRGDLLEAESALRVVLHLQQGFYGLEHSNTMTTFNLLIQHLKLQGKRDETVKMMMKAVKDMILGKPQTLSILR